MMIYLKNKQALPAALCVAWAAASSVSAMPGGELPIPKYQVMDEFGVNLASGQVSASVETVSIGGEMGLTHTISAHTNKFSIKGNDGYHDGFSGSLVQHSLGRVVRIGSSYVYPPDDEAAEIHVLRISALGESEDFKLMRNGEWDFWSYSRHDMYDPDVTFEALRDTRHTLTRESGGFKWTKPDGTEVYVTNMHANRVVYPNGFAIDINYPYSVTTNTGFQLKYHYVQDHSPNQSYDDPSIGNIPPEARFEWSVSNPRHVYAINNAVEWCTPTERAMCDLQYDWPRATFTWPEGMPRAIYVQPTIFRVGHPDGSETTFRFMPQDLTLRDPQDPMSGQVLEDYQRGAYIAPRLVAVKPATSRSETVHYEYENHFEYITSNGVTLPRLGTEATWVGITKRAEGVNGSQAYQRNRTREGTAAPMAMLGSKMRIVTGEFAATLGRVEIHGDQTVYFEDDQRGFVERVRHLNGPDKTYDYDSRNNLIKVTLPVNEGAEVTWQADYPDQCTNRKTCNKPTWVQDAKGHRTYYTYHPQSGQLATVTYPPNEEGLVAQTRYRYEQKHAYRKDAHGNRVRTADPIWLKVEESYCANSNYSEGCVNNDEVVTRYDYNHDNLLITGKTVTADGETLRTCFGYDVYGNRISETQPKANLATCN
jgi:hypothetical protein